METIILLVRYACGILAIWGKWTVFRRMGVPGICSVIPVYSDYLLYQKVWNKGSYGVLASLMYYYGILQLGMTILWPVFMILLADDKTLQYHPELVVEPREYFHLDDGQ